MPGWSASSTSAASLEASSACRPSASDRLPFRVAVVHSDASADQELDVADAFGVVADDHHDLLDARRRGRVDRVLDERLPAEPFDLLRGAEPPALARGEDHRGDHPSRFPNSRAKKRLMPAHIATGRAGTRRSPWWAPAPASRPRCRPRPWLDLLRRNALAQAVGELCGELAAHLGRAAAELGHGAGQVDVSLHLHGGGAILPGLEPARDARVRRPLPFASMPLAARTTRRASSSRSCIVTVPENARETGPTFMDLALPGGFVDDLGELGPGHARRDALDVEQERPRGPRTPAR